MTKQRIKLLVKSIRKNNLIIHEIKNIHTWFFKQEKCLRNKNIKRSSGYIVFSHLTENCAWLPQSQAGYHVRAIQKLHRTINLIKKTMQVGTTRTLSVIA